MFIARKLSFQLSSKRSIARLGLPCCDNKVSARLDSLTNLFLINRFHTNFETPSVEIVLEKNIKPSSPTPYSVQTHKLSYIDQLMTERYIPMALFYPKYSVSSSNDNTNNTLNSSEISSHLQKALSDVLTIYYPLAGRLVGDNISVSCNDKGATFKEVRIKCSMSKLLKKPHSILEHSVYPKGLPWNGSSEDGSLVVAQLSHFDCGGIAISVCITHKILDAKSVFNFFKDWASISRGQNVESLPRPTFDGALFFPPIEDFGNQPGTNYEVEKHKHISTRIMFTAEQIKKLKTIIAEDQESGVKNPTRLEIVAAFLIKYNLIAPSFRPFLFFILVDLRSQINPPLKGTCVGNFISFITISITEEQDLNLAKMVGKIRSEKIKFSKRFEGLKMEQLVNVAYEDIEGFAENAKMGFEYCSMTSLCNTPFYGIDFKWGKPERVTFPSLPPKNYFLILDDNHGGGVEATASIDEQVFPLLQKDEEFLAFATFDHPI